MPAASAPTVVMATTSTPHMSVTVAMATAHQNGIDTGLRSGGSQWRHRHRRGRQHGHYRQCAESRGSDQQKTIHLTFLPWAAVVRRRAMSLLPGSSVQNNIDRVGRRTPTGLKAARLRSFRTELEGVRQRKQKSGAAARVVGRAVAKRHRDGDVGPQIAAQKKPNAGAGRGERKTVGVPVAVIPGHAGVGKTVKLIARQVLEIQLLIETQFERTGDAIVAADLGTVIASPERSTAEVELL